MNNAVATPVQNRETYKVCIPPQTDLIGLDPFETHCWRKESLTNPYQVFVAIFAEDNKPLYAHYFAEAIGIDQIRAKSPRFNEWIEKIITH